MRYFWFICFFILTCSTFQLSGQQVNPFELRSQADSSVTKVDSDSSFSSNNSSIIVVEDSLQQPTILTDPEQSEVQIDGSLVDQQPEVSEEIDPTEPEDQNVIKINENFNPFELTSADSNVHVGNLEQIELPSNDSTSLFEEKGQDSTLQGNIQPIEETRVIQEERKDVPIPAKGKNLLVFWASLLCGLLIAISLNAKRNILGEIWKSFTNLNYMKLLQKEQRNGWSTPYIILYAVFLVNVSIFIRFVAIHYGVPLFEYSLWKISIFLISLVVLRHISLYIIAFMRKRLSESLNYNFIIITVNIITGLLLLPINLFIAFSNESISGIAILSGIIIMCVSLTIRWFRALVNSLRIIIGDSFHFLLYLCSCEIVPIIILIGYVKNLIN